MKKVLFLTLFMFLMMFNVKGVSALACDAEDMARLKGLAAGVSYNGVYVGLDGGETHQDYKVNFIGLTDEIYVSDSHYTFKVFNDNEQIIMQSGETDLEIYSKYCNHLRLKTITVNLAKYNYYSSYRKCQEEEYKGLYICDPWYSGNITDDEFNKVIEDNTESETVGLDEKVFSVFSNKFILFGSIFLIVIIIIVAVVITRNKNRLD